jgi:hypothetical protein
MARVYLETSFLSACVTTRSDPASIYRRDTSVEWWKTQRSRHQLFVTTEVIGELDAPGFLARDAALDLARQVPLLPLTEEVLGFASLLVQERVMPRPIAGDAIHVAACCIHAVDYLLTWNVRHLANPNKLTHFRKICLRAGVLSPLIVTPDMLWEDPDEQQ